MMIKRATEAAATELEDMKRVSEASDLNQVEPCACETALPEGRSVIGGDDLVVDGLSGVRGAVGARSGSPDAPPVDDLVRVLKELCLGFLSRDLVRSPNPPPEKDPKRNPGGN